MPLDSESRFWLGLLLLGVAHALLGGWLIHWFRRRRGYQPPWPYWKSLGFFMLSQLGSGLAGMVPGVGRFLSLVVAYAAIKYATGLGFIRALLLTILIALIVIALIAPIGFLLDVDFRDSMRFERGH